MTGETNRHESYGARMRGFDEILGPDIGVPSERHKSFWDRVEFYAK